MYVNVWLLLYLASYKHCMNRNEQLCPLCENIYFNNILLWLIYYLVI